MKSINKNKPISAKKYLKQRESTNKCSHNPNSHQRYHYDAQKQWVDQMIEFHLHDQQPQSLLAKRKLEEFSVHLDDDVGVSAFRRNQNSINMYKVSRNPDNSSEGWVEDETRLKQKSQPDSNNKDKRSQSAQQCMIRQTLKIRTQNQKKLSFKQTSLQKKKLNISFNNISPFQMQTVPQIQISKQLVKKVKSHSSRRPATALYYGASQKVLSLFQNQSETKKNQCDTMRIHSNKQVDSKVLGWRDNKFLKTFSFNSINKSVTRSKRGSQKVQKNINNSGENESFNQKENKENSKGKGVNGQRQIHARTRSQAFDYENSKDKAHKQDYGPYSQRKLAAMSQKSHILSKKIKSYQNIPVSIQQNNPQQKIRQSFSLESNLIAGRKSISTNKIQLNYDTDFSKPIKQQQSQHQSKFQSPDKQISAHMPSHLQQDFSTLINMLKHESQNIFGGQLHTYLTQIKNNSLYNYYFSGMANRKKNGKLALNTTGRANRQKRPKYVSEHERMRGLIQQKQIKRNHTEMHYAGLSVVKEKEDNGQFVRTVGKEFFYRQ